MHASFLVKSANRTSSAALLLRGAGGGAQGVPVQCPWAHSPPEAARVLRSSGVSGQCARRPCQARRPPEGRRRAEGGAAALGTHGRAQAGGSGAHGRAAEGRRLRLGWRGRRGSQPLVSALAKPERDQSFIKGFDSSLTGPSTHLRVVQVVHILQRARLLRGRHGGRRRRAHHRPPRQLQAGHDHVGRLHGGAQGGGQLHPQHACGTAGGKGGDKGRGSR